jgi:hypothetical protein
LATGCQPGSHGIIGNQIYVPGVLQTATLNTGDHEALQAIGRTEPLLSKPTLCDRLAENGLRFAIASSGSPGSSWLQCPSQNGVMINVRGVVIPQSDSDLYAPFPEETIPATSRNDRVVEVIVEHLLPDDFAVVVGWFCDPDTTQHKAGLGAELSLQSIRENDARLGYLLSSAQQYGFDVLIGSDHGFSTLREPVSVSQLLHSCGIGGSEAVYASGSIWLLNEAKEKIHHLIETLCEAHWVGPIFTKGSKPGSPIGLPGTFSFQAGLLQHGWRTPDVMFSQNWTDQKNAYGIAGMALGSKGVASHGTCSPYDMHNVLVAWGPSFLSGKISNMCSGIIDIAPTLYYLVTQHKMPQVDGRVLYEALTETHNIEQETQHIFTSEKQERKQYLEIWEIGGTQYLEKGWVEWV